VAVTPDWVQRPNGADVAWAYPPAAEAANLEGRATLACRIDGAGRLERCQVVSEAPLDAGFGQAALKMSARFQMRPVDKNGLRTRGANVRIPIRFALPKADT
jgi:protein TonB